MASGVCVLLRIQKGLLEINTNSPMVYCRTFPFFSFTGISGSENLFFFLIHLFFWLHWVFIAVCSLSLVVASGGYSLVMVLGLLVVVASFVFSPWLQLPLGLGYLSGPKGSKPCPPHW